MCFSKNTKKLGPRHNFFLILACSFIVPSLRGFDALESPDIQLIAFNEANMTSPEVSARLKFLNDSAHLLAITAPAVSRHVMSTYNALLSENNLEPTESHRRGTCGACGTIMILGQSAGLDHSRQLKRPDKGMHNATRNKSIIYHCEFCNERTHHRIPTSLPRHKPRTKRVSELAPVNSTKTTSSSTKSQLLSRPVAPETSNNSSKKRAKTRKLGGLQALLAKQKVSQSISPGFGLDMSDFMKK
jgi:ribonuclease MRP protein subunit SNM1